MANGLGINEFGKVLKFGQSESVLWHSLVGPTIACVSTTSSSHPLPRQHMDVDCTCHIIIWCLKMTKMSDTWKPLILPCQLVDIILTAIWMKRGSLWVCHMAPLV
jgi:hypothetical protein